MRHFTPQQWRRRIIWRSFCRQFFRNMGRGLGNATGWLIALWLTEAWWEPDLIRLVAVLAQHFRGAP